MIHLNIVAQVHLTLSVEQASCDSHTRSLELLVFELERPVPFLVHRVMFSFLIQYFPGMTPACSVGTQ